MRAAARLLLIVLLLAVAACGWRLRGQGSGASLEGIALFVDASAIEADVRTPVERGIRAAGAELAASPAAADAVLVLLDETVQRRAVSISAEARVQEYELAYGLRYRLDTSAGEPLITPETVQAADVYRYDPNNVLGTQSRADNLTERLRQDAARLLLLRAQAVLTRAAQE